MTAGSPSPATPRATEYWTSVVLPPTREKPRRQEASAVELADGGLLLLWSEFDGRSDNARATIMGMVSPDRGGTWGEMRTAVENPAGLNVMSPAVRRRADGGLGMVYSHREATSDASRMFVRSDDEGLTWSPEPAVRGGELHEVKSSIILQPGPAALTDGVREIHRVIAEWVAKNA